MNNKTSANSTQVSEFRLTITGVQCPDRPELLGRDIRYVLNVKAIGQEGQVIEGVGYTVSCAIDSDSRISFSGRGEGQISTVAGENFSIYGTPAPSAGLHEWMNRPLNVIVTSDAGVSTQVEYLMGRLCNWSTPFADFGHGGHLWISSHTEWVGEGTAARWYWSRNVDQAHLNIPSKGIATSRFTSAVGSDGMNGSVIVEFPFNKEGFIRGERFHVSMPSSWNTYTATIPYEGEIEVRPE